MRMPGALATVAWCWRWSLGAFPLGNELECFWRPECLRNVWASCHRLRCHHPHGHLPVPEPGPPAPTSLGSPVCVPFLQQPGSWDLRFRLAFQIVLWHFTLCARPTVSLFCLEWSDRLTLNLLTKAWLPRPSLCVELVFTSAWNLPQNSILLALTHF